MRRPGLRLCCSQATEDRFPCVEDHYRAPSLTLKVPVKNASENVACFSRLLHIFANIIYFCKYRGKQCEPNTDCSSGLGLDRLTKIHLEHFRRKKQSTFVLIGILRVSYIARNSAFAEQRDQLSYRDRKEI